MVESGKWKEWGRKILEKVVLIILGILIGAFLSPIINPLISPLTSPVENFLNPPIRSAKITPNPEPISMDNGKYAVRVNIKNNGTADLERIRIDYKMKCLMNESEREIPKKTFLGPDDETFFKFEIEGLNPNCSITPEPVVFKFYKDEKGREYLKVEDSESKVCMFCPLEINLTSDNFYHSYNYYYPYIEGELEITGGPVEGVLPYEEAPNKTELTYIQQKDILMTAIDIRTICLKGAASPSWCRNISTKD